jgi:hypothetical protein
VTAILHFPVHIVGISRIEEFEYFGQGICSPGDHNEMNVVIHKAVTQNIQTVFHCIFPEPLEID